MKFTASGRTAAIRFALLTGVAATALPTAAHAQDMEDAQEVQEQVDSDGDNIDDASDAQTGNVIIVTATKREQTLQETPVAVSVTTAETIERAQIRDVADLATVVPSLSVSQSQSSFATTYSVRGFGTSGNNIGLEPSVAMFVDGVYRSRSISQISDLPDIQRVEVLRGPQSTLFGKNASAGVISIVTKEPEFDLGGMVEASYGNYNAVVVKGYLTGGLSENIAASVAGGYNRRDGYVTNAFNGDDLNDRNRWFGRAQLLFDNADALKVRLIADYDEIDEKCCAAFNVRPSGATQIVQAIGGQVNDFRGVPDADIVYSDVVPFNKVKNWGLSGQLDYDLSDTLSLTSITAYRETRLRANQDVDFTSADIASGGNIGQADIDTLTQELRLASNFDGPVNFLIGGYYFDETVREKDQIVYGEDFRPYVDFSIQALTDGVFSANTVEALVGAAPNTLWQAGQGFFNDMVQKDEAYSIFGNLDFEVVEGLVLTLGANYTHDDKSLVTNSVSTDAFSAIDLDGAALAPVRANLLGQIFFATAVGQQLGLVDAAGDPRRATATEVAGFITYLQSLGMPGLIALSNLNTLATNFGTANANNAELNPFGPLRDLQFLPPFVNCPNAVESCSFSDGDMSYTVRLAYDVTPSLNAYASWSTGYKAASFNISRDSRPTAADRTAIIAGGYTGANLTSGSRFALPEESEVWEVGLKGNWDYAAANLTFFLQNLDNFQDNTFTGTGFILGNAGKRETFGVEFDGYVQPMDQLTLNLALTYLDSTYKSYPGSPLGDVSGESVLGTPELFAVFGAQWDQEFANGDHLILRGDFGYESLVVPDPGLLDYIGENPDGTPDYAPAFAAARAYQYEVNNLNASISYVMDMGLELTVWGRNLLDDRNITGVFDSVAQDRSISGYTNQPRTYGVGARYRF